MYNHNTIVKNKNPLGYSTINNNSYSRIRISAWQLGFPISLVLSAINPIVSMEAWCGQFSLQHISQLGDSIHPLCNAKKHNWL